MIGTPEYMSPEQAEAKEVDHRSDIYSLGHDPLRNGDGRVPFEGETALSVAIKHKGETPKDPKTLNPSIPDDLSRVILKCLEKDKGKRYQTRRGSRAELDKIEKGIPTTERVVPERKALTSKQITVQFDPKKAHPAGGRSDLRRHRRAAPLEIPSPQRSRAGPQDQELHRGHQL